jgi:hypothetical protein
VYSPILAFSDVNADRCRDETYDRLTRNPRPCVTRQPAGNRVRVLPTGREAARVGHPRIAFFEDQPALYLKVERNDSHESRALYRNARTSRITEVDLDVGGNREALVGMHLFALIPGQGASQLPRQLANVLGKRSNNSRRVLAGDLDECRPSALVGQNGLIV